MKLNQNENIMISRTIEVGTSLPMAEITSAVGVSITKTAMSGTPEGVWILVPYEKEENPVVIAYLMGGRYWQASLFQMANPLPEQLKVTRIFRPTEPRKKS
jgi:hypothetical protein